MAKWLVVKKDITQEELATVEIVDLPGTEVNPKDYRNTPQYQLKLKHPNWEIGNTIVGVDIDEPTTQEELAKVCFRLGFSVGLYSRNADGETVN